MSFRQRSGRPAVPSSARACRSIPAICWCSARLTASRHRRAGLRPQPQGKRFRLGARPVDCRARRDGRRHRRHGRRRAADGNPDPAAAARAAAGAESELKVDIVLLAAGRSSRMGGPNKLLALFDGKPLVRRTAERALGSKAAGTIVVTGHQRERGARGPRRGSMSDAGRQSGFRRRPVVFAEGRHRSGCRTMPPAP